MIASKIENVDFEGDIREFILAHYSHDLETMTINDLCHAAASSSLVSSPTSSKPCGPLKKSSLQISDLAMRRVPHDHQGNRDPLPSVLVTRALSIISRTRAYTTRTETQAADASATASPESSGPNLTIQVPSPSTPHDLRDLSQYRVCLAQDVARAIARAYELRSVQKHSLQYEDSLASPELENNSGGGGDEGSPRAEHGLLSDANAVGPAAEAVGECDASPETNDCDDQTTSPLAIEKRPDAEEEEPGTATEDRSGPDKACV
jgi:hypothetical protein